VSCSCPILLDSDLAIVLLCVFMAAPCFEYLAIMLLVRPCPATWRNFFHWSEWDFER
jgi:hypothetical protein